MFIHVATQPSLLIDQLCRVTTMHCSTSDHKNYWQFTNHSLTTIPFMIVARTSTKTQSACINVHLSLSAYSNFVSTALQPWQQQLVLHDLLYLLIDHDQLHTTVQ
jgi:hypothetical protein